MRKSDAELLGAGTAAEPIADAVGPAARANRGTLAASEQARLDAEAGQQAAEDARDAAEDARDAAEQGRATAEQATLEAQLAQRNLQNFLAMAAHDLHNPITGIIGYAQLLQRPRISPEVHARAVRSIERSALQMSRLIRDLVDAGNAGAGSFPLSPRSTDLTALVRQAAESPGQTSERHRVVVDAPERLEGHWDPDRLGQVVTNLVANAIKYSPEGGEIAVHLASDGDTAVIRVTDRGIGIRAEDLHLLFRPFSRLPDGAKLEGTGLGLYISHGIVAAHGGRLSAESRGPGHGATFTVRLPLDSRPGGTRTEPTS
jgi:signal transduction histidine kinase